jgi:DNA-binding LacI/PurR family transcriptional regulator
MTRRRPAAGATILDIARQLGLSHATVSRALSDHPHVSDRTKARVHAAADSMHYIPNASARTMRGAPNPLVGLVIPDVQNDFYATVARIVADTLAAQSYRMVLAVTEDDPEREARDLRALAEARVAGVIVTLTAAPRPATLALLKSLRTVQLVRTHRRLNTDAVALDDRAGISLAAEHLLSQGHRRIAYIGGLADLSTGEQRLAGFLDACRDHAITPPSRLIELGAPRPEFARDATARLMALKVRPTALVLGSSELTLGSLQSLQAARIRCPHDVSVVGYGDPPWFALAQHGITTVRLPVNEVALTAASLLLQRLHASRKADGEPDAACASSRFVPTLTIRASTAAVSRSGSSNRSAARPNPSTTTRRAS